jgi:hypothetical protein
MRPRCPNRRLTMLGNHATCGLHAKSLKGGESMKDKAEYPMFLPE